MLLRQAAAFQTLNTWEAKEFENSPKAYQNDPGRVLGDCHHTSKCKPMA